MKTLGRLSLGRDIPAFGGFLTASSWRPIGRALALFFRRGEGCQWAAYLEGRSKSEEIGGRRSACARLDGGVARVGGGIRCPLQLGPGGRDRYSPRAPRSRLRQRLV